MRCDIGIKNLDTREPVLYDCGRVLEQLRREEVAYAQRPLRSLLGHLYIPLPWKAHGICVEEVTLA